MACCPLFLSIFAEKLKIFLEFCQFKAFFFLTVM